MHCERAGIIEGKVALWNCPCICKDKPLGENRPRRLREAPIVVKQHQWRGASVTFSKTMERYSYKSAINAIFRFKKRTSKQCPSKLQDYQRKLPHYARSSRGKPMKDASPHEGYPPGSVAPEQLMNWIGRSASWEAVCTRLGVTASPFPLLIQDRPAMKSISFLRTVFH